MVDLVTETLTAPGSYVRVAAQNGTVVVDLTGAGGCGYADQAGGGGVWVRKTYTVTSGQSFTFVVPDASLDGSDGDSATFQITGSTILGRALGGEGGSSTSMGGSASGSTGDTKYSGGAGDTAQGGGGGAASSIGPGGDGGNPSGGSGDGAGGDAPDGNGNYPGGGGASVNGNGAGGRVVITWTPAGGGGSTPNPWNYYAQMRKQAG